MPDLQTQLLENHHESISPWRWRRMGFDAAPVEIKLAFPHWEIFADRRQAHRSRRFTNGQCLAPMPSGLHSTARFVPGFSHLGKERISHKHQIEASEKSRPPASRMSSAVVVRRPKQSGVRRRTPVSPTVPRQRVGLRWFNLTASVDQLQPAVVICE